VAERADSAAWITLSIAALGTSLAGWSNSTVAKPTVGSVEIAFAPY
jgi:hypothetical protein